MKLIRAARLVPVLSPALNDGGLLMEGDRLLDVGPFSCLLKAHPGAEVEDQGPNSIVLPPLVNAHTHLELTHFPQWSAGLPEPDSFVGWIKTVIEVKRQINPGQLEASLKEGIRQSLELGTGFVGDILSHHPLGQIYHDGPLKGRLFFETLGIDPERTRQSLDHIAGYLNPGHIGPMQTGVSPHSPYTLSQAYLKQVNHTAHSAGWPVSIHLGESIEEVLFTRLVEGPMVEDLYPYVGWENSLPEATGFRPWPYLVKFDGGGKGDLLAHGVQVEPEDVAAMADAGVSVVLCPRSNARLQVGTAPVGWYQALGVPLALGTDSLASNTSLSVWEEMDAAHSLYQGGLTPEKLLKLATVEGGTVLGYEEGELGLVPDSPAHYLVLESPVLPPLEETAAFLCKAQRQHEVRQLVLQGKAQLPRA